MAAGHSVRHTEGLENRSPGGSGPGVLRIEGDFLLVKDLASSQESYAQACRFGSKLTIEDTDAFVDIVLVANDDSDGTEHDIFDVEIKSTWELVELILVLC